MIFRLTRRNACLHLASPRLAVSLVRSLMVFNPLLAIFTWRNYPRGLDVAAAWLAKMQPIVDTILLSTSIRHALQLQNAAKSGTKFVPGMVMSTVGKSTIGRSSSTHVQDVLAANKIPARGKVQPS